MESFKEESFNVESRKNHVENVITRPPSETVVALEKITEFSHTTSINSEKKHTFSLDESIPTNSVNNLYRGVIYMDWILSSDAFGFINYKSLESLLMM
jgi:hypothetical protein